MNWIYKTGYRRYSDAHDRRTAPTHESGTSNRYHCGCYSFVHLLSILGQQETLTGWHGVYVKYLDAGVNPNLFNRGVQTSVVHGFVITIVCKHDKRR